MNFNNIIKTVKRYSMPIVRFVRRNDTKILVTVGVVGTIGGTVMACKATDKAKEIVEDFKIERDSVEESEMTPEEKKSAVVDIYKNTGIKLVKTYTPSVITLGASVTSIFMSHHINVKKIASVTAAYSTLDEMFKNYRGNVVNKYGKDEDLKLLYGLTEEEIDEVTLDKNGKEKKVKKKILVAPDGSSYSGYSRIFDELNPWFRKDDWVHNKTFLAMAEDEFNNRLQSNGHVFLNEVYDALGYEKTIAGQSVGWLKNGNGDGYISFGIEDLHKKSSRDFIFGREGAVILDFNVDGVILDKEGLGYAKI